MFLSHRARCLALLLGVVGPGLADAQVIEFDSQGLHYQTLSRQGLTLMYAPLPLTVRRFAVVQVSFSNGSARSRLVGPTDFYFEAAQGRVLRAAPEEVVVRELYRKAGRNEVMKLQVAYEKALYGNQKIRSNNGYEKRRQAALVAGSKGLKAAAAASALSLVRTHLAPGGSTDGAIFFENGGKSLGEGRLVTRLRNGDVFEFRPQSAAAE